MKQSNTSVFTQRSSLTNQTVISPGPISASTVTGHLVTVGGDILSTTPAAPTIAVQGIVFEGGGACTTTIGGSQTCITAPMSTSYRTLTLVPSTTDNPVPAESGVPGCAYVIAGDLGAEALCSLNYCNCGGTVAPLLTSSSISGTKTLDCDYKTQPTTNSCPTE